MKIKHLSRLNKNAGYDIKLEISIYTHEPEYDTLNTACHSGELVEMVFKEIDDMHPPGELRPRWMVTDITVEVFIDSKPKATISLIRVYGAPPSFDEPPTTFNENGWIMDMPVDKEVKI